MATDLQKFLQVVKMINRQQWFLIIQIILFLLSVCASLVFFFSPQSIEAVIYDRMIDPYAWGFVFGRLSVYFSCRIIRRIRRTA